MAFGFTPVEPRLTGYLARQVVAISVTTGPVPQMYLPDMSLTGEVIITNIQAAPAVRRGNGRVVTATFKHSSGDCINLALSSNDTGETIGTTGNHPFWSVDRRDFVQAGSLQLDERVETYSGDTIRVISKLARPCPESFYNLEVHGEHVYYVGQQGVLVHNTQSYKADAVAGVDQEILVRHRAGNTSNA